MFSFSVIINAIRGIINFVKRITRIVFNFLTDCVNWFKSKHLNKNTDIPFIANIDQFKEALDKAPVKNVGIFEGVYNEATDKITYSQIIEANSLDDQTKNILGKEKLVVLS